MTAQELHIDYDINLQKISTNATRNIEPEEVDWLLNKEVIKFLNKRTRGISDSKRRGFEEDTKRLKDIEPLLKTVILDVEQIEERKGRVILPSFNYKNLKAKAIYYKDCEASNGKEVGLVQNIFKFKLPTTDNLKVTLTIFGIKHTIFNTNTLPSTYIGGKYMNLLRAFIITIRKALLTEEYKDVKIYYEWFGEVYEQDTFFVVGNTKLGNVKVQPTIQDQQDYIVTKSTYTFKRNVSDKDITKPVRFATSESIDWKENSYLSGSIPESPIAEFTKGNAFVYFPKNTIVKQLIFTYICRPNIIDIYLGTSLNLDTDVCAEIVIQTTKFTKALIDSDNYEKYFNETNLIE